MSPVAVGRNLVAVLMGQGTLAVLARIALVGMVTVVSLGIVRIMGLPGLVMMSVGAFVAVTGMIITLKFPVGVFAFWLLSMSGLHTLGMIRMPGLPDFMFPRLLMMVLMFLVPAGILMGRRIARPPFAPDLLIIFYTLYVFANFLVIGHEGRFNTWLSSVFAPMLAYFFAKQFISEENHLKLILWSLVGVTVYFWITSIGEHFEIEQIVWPKRILDREYGLAWYGRSRGPFVQPALFGQIIGMYMLIHVYLLTRRIHIGLKVFVAINTALAGLALLYTYTRGGWLATAVGLMVLFALRPRYRKLLAIVFVVGFLAASVNLLQPQEDEFLAERMENVSTIDNRLGFLAAAVRMIGDYPIFGVGYFNFNDYQVFYNQGTYIPFYGFVTRGAGADVPIHDIYIGRAAEEGLVGLILFLSFFALIFKNFVKLWRTDPQGEWFDRDFLALVAAMAISYFVGGMVIDYRYFDLINCLIGMLAGIVVGYPRTNADSRRALMRGAKLRSVDTLRLL